jgi:predicted Zn-dependent peptidase
MEDVEAARLEDVEAFFRRFYVPSNASLCLVGDLTEDRALALAERYFGLIPGGVRSLRTWPSPANLDGDVEIDFRDRVELERVYLTWPTAPLFHADDAALTLLADLLTRGKSSRLYRKLVMDLEIAQDVSAYHSARELAGSFGVHATIRPGRSLEQARDLIDDEIRAIAREGVTQAELERVKNGRLAGFFHALESIGGFGGVADRLNAYNVYLSDPGRITTDFRRYEEVTLEAVSDVARRYLADRPRVHLAVLSRKPPKTALIDRATPPVSAPAVPYRPPAPQVLELRCGLPLWVISQRDLPLVALTLVLGGGAAVQPHGRSGLAELTSAMMDEGTSTRSAAELAEAAERMGTALTTSCGWDGSYVSLRCLSPHLSASLDLAVDILRNPVFPDSEWQRVRGQALASLQSEQDSAEARGYRRFLLELYPTEHPYRLPIDGDAAEVEALTRDDLVSFHLRHHGPGDAACIVAGDVDPKMIALAIDDRLAEWFGARPICADLLQPPLPSHPRILVLDRPGAVQAAVRVGHIGMHRLAPDYTDALVLNQILGGQFSSRLNARLREEKGFTYSVRSHFDFRRGAGPFSIAAAVQTEKVAEALDDIRSEMLALRDQRPPTDRELEDARRCLIEGQARHFETPSDLISRFAALFVHGLPVDHHAQFAERLGAVSVESLHAVAARRLHPESLVAVVVADAALVAEPLARVDWAEVVVLKD